MDAPWITVAEAARQSGYSARTIEMLLKTGRIPEIKPDSNWVVVPGTLWITMASVNPLSYDRQSSSLRSLIPFPSEENLGKYARLRPYGRVTRTNRLVNRPTADPPCIHGW